MAEAEQWVRLSNGLGAKFLPFNRFNHQHKYLGSGLRSGPYFRTSYLVHKYSQRGGTMSNLTMLYLVLLLVYYVVEEF